MINIKTETAKMLQDEYGIDELITAVLFENGMLSFKACRDTLIKKEYYKKAQPKEKQFLRSRLADKYCVSMSSVEKMTV